MPEQVRCPSCNATLRVPDTLLGKNVKCPKCQTTFVAETDAPDESEGIVREPVPSSRRRPSPPPEEFDDEPPPEEEADEDRPRRRRRRGRRAAAAESAVVGPAISIMVVSGLSIVLGLVDLAFRVLGIGLMAGASASGGAPPGQAAGQTIGMILGGIFDVLSLILPVVMLIGAIKMKNLQNYGLAITSCIIAMLPIHCCCILGLPFGIWGVVMLNKPEVKDAFS